MAPSRLVLGTRGSALALVQARLVSAGLRAAHPGLVIVERIVRTEGDARAQDPPAAFEEPGAFVRALERELAQRTIDLAVHSLKDLTTEATAGLTLAAVLAREDPRDALVSSGGFRLETLPAGATVGTTSARRRCQLLHARPDLAIVPLRGNVDTRVRAVQEGQLVAAVLAMAGLLRLGVSGVAIEPLALASSVPAVGQGAIVVQTRSGDAAALAARALDHPPTAAAVAAERAFLRRLGGGCLAPVGAHARCEEGVLDLEAVVGSADGTVLLLDRERGPADRAELLGTRLAERLIAAGSARLLAGARLPA